MHEDFSCNTFSAAAGVREPKNKIESVVRCVREVSRTNVANSILCFHSERLRRVADCLRRGGYGGISHFHDRNE
jgi:hypothetical protein